MSITVKSGVSASSQESSFGNATLQTVSDTHVLSIAVTLPDGAAQAAGVDLDDAGKVSDWLASVFASALAVGCYVEAQVGPEED